MVFWGLLSHSAKLNGQVRGCGLSEVKECALTGCLQARKALFGDRSVKERPVQNLRWERVLGHL